MPTRSSEELNEVHIHKYVNHGKNDIDPKVYKNHAVLLEIRWKLDANYFWPSWWYIFGWWVKKIIWEKWKFLVAVIFSCRQLNDKSTNRLEPKTGWLPRFSQQQNVHLKKVPFKSIKITIRKKSETKIKKTTITTRTQWPKMKRKNVIILENAVVRKKESTNQWITK